MATVILIFLVALGIAVLLGWTVDTRDGADWRTADPPPATRADRHLAPEGTPGGPHTAPK